MRYLIFVIVIIVSISCSKEPEELLEDYLVENGIEAIKHSSGLYYVIEKEGEGEHPTKNSFVTMDYEGTYLDGVKFDSSYDRGEPLKYDLKGLIAGWQIGVPLFKKGGKGTLYIPPRLGYGTSPSNGIRDNAVLIFDIELLDFK